MPDVFLSHSSRDSELAYKLVEYLESKGLTCWVAPRDIIPGTDWAATISAAVNSAVVFLIIYSANSAASEQCARELSIAEYKKTVFVVPYKADDTALTGTYEYYLLGAHWVVADPAAGDYKLNELYGVISGLKAGRTAETSSYAPAVSGPDISAAYTGNTDTGSASVSYTPEADKTEKSENNVKYCSNCGAELSDTAKFCSKCGEKTEYGKKVPQKTSVRQPFPSFMQMPFGAPVQYPARQPSYTQSQYTAPAPTPVQNNIYTAQQYAPPAQFHAPAQNNIYTAQQYTAPVPSPSPVQVHNTSQQYAAPSPVQNNIYTAQQYASPMPPPSPVQVHDTSQQYAPPAPAPAWNNTYTAQTPEPAEPPQKPKSGSESDSGQDIARWICPDCGTKNKLNELYCVNCARSRKLVTDVQWLCEKCGAQNSMKDMFCNNCGGNRTYISPKSGSEASESSLSGLQNVFSGKIKSAKKKRQAEKPQPDPEKGEWLCRKCGTVNQKLSSFCKDCGAYK